MPKKPDPVSVILSPNARQDIREISRWSELKFGKEAAMRYRSLLGQALRDLEADPERPGSNERPELLVPGARTYHLALSRSRAGGSRVKRPRHYVLYRALTPGLIEIARILHDSRDLAKHLPADYRGDE